MKIKESQTHREMGTENHGFLKEIAGLPKKGVMRILEANGWGIF
jgi:hypothetical protein